ncbi:two-component-system connector protein YcgZ [Duffyella gerundensis]|uniref:Two-component-system connector protein YcgZ n=2 Tax=Erwiniaceae TaxID=1903409 RepID=A0A0U5L6E3_9GAMM|nr:two-component-system connector protein YcgZ [Duffyella gerundensis]CUU24039.1 hypothetical protein EM595_1805 [Duffyella gerundensis]
MLQQRRTPEAEHTVSDYMQSSNDAFPSSQETLGHIVTDIIRAGETVSRKAICAKLLARLSDNQDPELEKQYHELIALLLGRE